MNRVNKLSDIKNNPHISVIIPAYNVELYISSTINSVLNQTYNNIEIIVVDDGSKDKTRRIVEDLSLHHRNIHYLWQNNSGVSDARNYGISKASGEYIAFIDGDDLWKPEKIELQVRQIEEDNTKACYTGYEILDRGQLKGVSNQYQCGEIFCDSLLGNLAAWTGTWLVEKAFLLKHSIEFSSCFNWAEDTEYFNKVISMTRISVVKKSLAEHRIRDNSLTEYNTGYSARKIQEVLAYMRLLEWVKEKEKDIASAEQAIRILERIVLPEKSLNHLFMGWRKNIDQSRYISRHILWSNIEKYDYNINISSVKFVLKKTILTVIKNSMYGNRFMHHTLF